MGRVCMGVCDSGGGGGGGGGGDDDADDNDDDWVMVNAGMW